MNQPITVAAQWCSHWRQGVYDVWHLRGDCYLNQGLTYARGEEAVLWVVQRPGGVEVIAYFETADGSRVVVDQGPGGRGSTGAEARQQVTHWFARLQSAGPPRLELPPPAATPDVKPEIYYHGLAQFDPERQRQVELTQFTEFAPTPIGVESLPPGMRRWQVFPRNDLDNNFEWKQLPSGEHVALVTGGVRVVVEGLAAAGLPGQLGPVGAVDISTDRAVIWTSGVDSSFAPGGVQSQDAPLEIYMEGNIEFRQGERVVYADRMFYDVRRQIGIILNAELLTPLPRIKDRQYQGLVRLKAAAIQQLDASHFRATDALVTTSLLEEPAYHFGSQQIYFQDVQQTMIDPRTGTPVLDPATGGLAVEHQQIAESRGNFLYVRNIPVLYWPTIATNLTKPTFFIDRVSLGDDDIFGTQVLADFDAYQLFGIRNAPEGTEWGISLDHFSKRGTGFGSDFQYDRADVFGWEGPARGQIEFWGIDDDGLDNLGFGRRAVDPEKDFRYSLIGEHRQRLASGWEITGEAGWVSDRTFLEQYYETEWDEYRSPRTGARAKRYNNNSVLSVEANGQVNDFFTETEWLPRADHYWLGESLLGDRLTWFAHSQAAYAQLNNATTPTEPTLASLFTPLPWEVGPGQEGERLITRQEIDLPFALGPIKFVPYALGELARWGEALDGDALDRTFYQAGIRSSLPVWRTFPGVRNPLFNLTGLAHKVVFDLEVAFAEANRNYDELPLYDPLDDTSITEFRRRLFDPTLAPNIDFTDPKFDPRFYAIRTGIQSWVTAPAAEMVEDQFVVRGGVRQRLQTKRGGPGRQHLVDWMTLDFNASYFPKEDRDNLGQDFGLVNYDFRWHVGDRLTIVSDGAADFFGQGLRTISGGVMINRPTRWNGYAGFRSIDGPFSSNVVLTNTSYRLSPKWITSASAAWDLGATGSIGQTFSMTRIGESLLVSLGVNVDNAKDNVGFRLLVEPRFLPKKRLTHLTGIDVPPAGAFGLE